MCDSGFNETDVCTCICTFCEGTLAFLPHPLPLKRLVLEKQIILLYACTCTLYTALHHTAHTTSMHLVV